MDPPSISEVEEKCSPYVPLPGENPQIIALKQCSNSTACLNAKTIYNAKVEAYNRKIDELDAQDMELYNSRKREFSEKENRWVTRSGEYSNFKNHGISQDFEIHWGWWDWDTSNACRECARGQWTSSSGANCSPNGTPLLNADSYYDNGRWGWHNWHAGSRKWWTCSKNQNAIDSENREREKAKPVFTEQPPVPRAKINLTPTGNTAVACCANLMNIYGDATRVTQNCEQNIEQTIQQLQNPPPSQPVIAPSQQLIPPPNVVANPQLIPEPVRTTTIDPGPSVPNPSNAQSSLVDTGEDQADDNNKDMYVSNNTDLPRDNVLVLGSIGGISLVSVCCCLLILLVLLFSSKN